MAFRDPANAERKFIADITIVSDSALDDANPVRSFSENLARLAEEIGLNPNHLDYRIDEYTDGQYPNAKRTLRLPPRDHMAVFLRTHVGPGLREIKERGLSHRTLKVVQGNVSFSVGYNASQLYMSGSYGAYHTATSLRRNPLWNKLEEKYQRQLQYVPTDTLSGLIVCDAGCALINARHYAPGTYRVEDIIREFFREHPDVHFVLLISAERTSLSQSASPLVLKPYLYRATPSNKEPDWLLNVFEMALRRFPEPVLDPANSHIQTREPGYRLGHHGGHKMGGTRVTISARELAELLAGELTPERFNELHGWDQSAAGGPRNLSPFARFLLQGRMIQSIAVEPGTEDDDHWVTFEFGEPHPAISSFVVPKT